MSGPLSSSSPAKAGSRLPGPPGETGSPSTIGAGRSGVPAPRLCEVIAAPTMGALRAGRDAVSDADIVELRLDTVDRPDVAAALHGRTRPVIVTCRAAWEGGAFTGSEEERQRILREALDAGAEFVDIEHRAVGVERWLRREDREQRVICSLHDFDRMPADLADRVRDMRATGAAIVKVAGRAERLRDLLPLLAIGRAQRDGDRTVLIGMGAAGVASRLLAAHFGSCWTYAGPAIAPGQVPASRMLQEFHFRAITAATPVYAVVGHPIGHSISPAMHNAAFAAAGIDAVYIPCDAGDFDDFLALAAALPIAGASVTAPHKLAAFECAQPALRGDAADLDRDAQFAREGDGDRASHLDLAQDLDQDLTRLRAANTLRRRPANANASAVASPNAGPGAAADTGSWQCANTDVAGFIAPLRARLALDGARVAVLGAGGAARAVVAGLDAAGADITIYARNDAAAADAVSVAAGRACAKPFPVPAGSWDVLVNTTPVGTFPAVDDTPFHGPFDGHLVYDLIYNPRPTRLLRDARAAGCATLDGLDMLVEQAARQFQWWTGRTPSTSLMHDAAIRRIAEMQDEVGQ
jgi:3-dehydroquinate dehydratase/shikimate dehydrogenase